MLQEHERPRAHLVQDDFLSPEALAVVFRELRGLQKRLRPGLVREVGHDGQSVFFAHEARRRNKAVWIHDPSRTLRLFREHLWSPENVAQLEDAREPLFQVLPHCSAPHLQVSSYMTGDHYDFHLDEGAGVNLTAVVFLAADPAKVRGGDLVLAYDGEEKAIRFRHNRLVVFPSKTPHRVTRVRVDSEDPAHARISLQCWLTYGAEKGKTKAKRAAEADRPTFLLSEEPIVAAAQGLCPSASGDAGTEELYWGAFYLTRVLSSNLRAVAAPQEGLTLGPTRIRREEELEVYATGKHAGAPVRVGFVLRGPEVEPSLALHLFVERGRGKAARRVGAVVPPGADEEETERLLRRLLARVGKA